ncbi:MAG: PQQ-like beta-propeller repeat protein [Planctomycetes bacterium]|nr:PQQ-like beta-propeller repeat protein [Planctomycetota bacterium]
MLLRLWQALLLCSLSPASGEPAVRRVVLLPLIPANPAAEKVVEEVGKLLVNELEVQPELSCRALSRAELLALEPCPLKAFVASASHAGGGADVVLLARVSVFEALRELDMTLFDGGGEVLGCVWDHGYAGPNGGRFDRVGRDDLALPNAMEYLVGNILQVMDFPARPKRLIAVSPFEDAVSAGDYREGVAVLLATCLSDSGEAWGLARPGEVTARWAGPLAESMEGACGEATQAVKGKVHLVGEIPTIQLSLERSGREAETAQQSFQGPQALRGTVQQLARALRSGGSDRLIWSFRSAARASGSPVFSEGAVHFTAEDEHLYSISLASGELRHQALVEHSAHGMGTVGLAGPFRLGQALAVVTERGSIIGYSPKDLKPLWRASVGSAPRPVGLTSSGLFLAAGDELTLVREDGKVAWTAAVSGTVSGGCEAGGRWFFGSGDQRFHGASVLDGQEAWATDLDDRPCGIPAADAESIYFGTEDARFHAVRQANGERRWSIDLEDSATGAARFMGGLLLVPCSSGSLYGVDPAAGRVFWKQNLCGRGTPLLVPAGGRILLVRADGVLEARSNFEKTPDWTFQMPARARFPALFISKAELDGSEDLDVEDRSWIVVGDEACNMFALDAGGE